MLEEYARQLRERKLDLGDEVSEDDLQIYLRNKEIAGPTLPLHQIIREARYLRHQLRMFREAEERALHRQGSPQPDPDG